jgi:hypothetical protein
MVTTTISFESSILDKLIKTKLNKKKRVEPEE